MGPTRRKTAKKTKRSRQETILSRAGLVRNSRLTDAQRKLVAKLTIAEVKALASVKRKLRYRGSLHVGGRGIIF